MCSIHRQAAAFMKDLGLFQTTDTERRLKNIEEWEKEVNILTLEWFLCYRTRSFKSGRRWFETFRQFFKDTCSGWRTGCKYILLKLLSTVLNRSFPHTSVLPGDNITKITEQEREQKLRVSTFGFPLSLEQETKVVDVSFALPSRSWVSFNLQLRERQRARKVCFAQSLRIWKAPLSNGANTYFDFKKAVPFEYSVHWAKPLGSRKMPLLCIYFLA